MVQNPLQLGGGEVGVDEQAGMLANVAGKFPVGLQLLTQGTVRRHCHTMALPHRPAGVFVPDHGGLPLVGDADGCQLVGGHPGFGQHLSEDGVLGGPDLHGVLLHPAWLGVDLGQLPLGRAHDILLPVKEDAPAAGGPLVQSRDIALHRRRPFLSAPAVRSFEGTGPGLCLVLL